MSNELVRITKIASNVRLSDRYLTVQIKDAPDPEQTSTYGRLCALVEIEGSWQSNSQIGQTIINTLSRQYFRGTAHDPLTNFEEALKKVNETLTHASHTGSTDWIGHLHAAVIVVIRNEIHIATTGQVYAMLFRDTHATPMLDEKRDTPTVPGKIFGTLLSGTIEGNDQLLIASSGLQKIAAQEEIQQCFSSAQNANEAIQKFGELLRAKRGKWIGALTIDAAGTLVEQGAQTILVEEATGLQLASRLAQLRSTTSRILKPAAGWFHKTSAATKETIQERIIPRSKEHLEQTKTWPTKLQEISKPLLAKAKTWLSSLKQRQSTTNEIPTVTTTTKTTSQPQIENLIGKSVYAIRDYNELPEATQIQQRSPVVVDYSESKRPARKFNLSTISIPDLRSLAAKIEWRPIIFGLIALILSLVLFSNIRVITKQKETEQSKQAFQAQLSILQDRLEEGRLARIFNQPEKATAALQDVLTGLPPLLNSPVVDGAKALQEKTQIEIDTLTLTNRLSDLKQIAHIDNAAKLIRAQDLLILSDSKGATLTSLRITDASTKTLPLSTGQHISAMAAYDGKPGSAILTDQGTYELDAAGQQLTAATTAGEGWKTSVALASFFNNLYALDITENQIWKYTSTKNGFSKADGYITDGTKLADSIDIAVDGQLFILKKSGEVLRFNKGKVDKFTLSEPPAPTNTIANAKQLVTTKDSSYLYLLDGARILRFDKSGKYQSQYAFKDIDSVDSFALDEPNKTFFLSTKGTIYSASF
jgi:type II secretory pathway pseudopilin PulG